MARPTSKTTPKRRPKLCRHKTGQGYVTLHGHRHYLGVWGPTDSPSPEVAARYAETLADWEARGRTLVNPHDITIVELVEVYVRTRREANKRDGDNCHAALRPLWDADWGRDWGWSAPFGRTAAADFGPLRLQAVRSAMESSGKWSRPYINRCVKRIRRMFAWAVTQEMLPPAVHHALTTVEPLRRGQTTAPEPGRVLPVPDAHVEAIREHVPRQVWALIQLQRYSGRGKGRSSDCAPATST